MSFVLATPELVQGSSMSLIGSPAASLSSSLRAMNTRCPIFDARTFPARSHRSSVDALILASMQNSVLVSLSPAIREFPFLDKRIGQAIACPITRASLGNSPRRLRLDVAAPLA
jgi:hypothetical protein